MKKILVIDDQALVRSALKKVLTREGYAVREAQDGPIGLSMIQEDMPDLIILDRGLPLMSGSHVLYEIRKISRDVRVIVLTGFPDAPGELEYRKLGVSQFLSKDIGMDELIRVIDHELSASAG